MLFDSTLSSVNSSMGILDRKVTSHVQDQIIFLKEGIRT